jgi:hypothetical protein
MMLKVLVYRHATRTFSSRKLARKMYEDVAFGASELGRRGRA